MCFLLFCFGSILGAFGDFMASGGQLGRLWAPKMKVLGILGGLGGILGGLGTKVKDLEANLGGLGGQLGASWGQLGRSWRPSWRSWGQLGRILEPTWEVLEPS